MTVDCVLEQGRIQVSQLGYQNPTLDLYLSQTSGGSRIFRREGGANSQSGCANLFFGRKLHENERIWTPSLGVSGAPLRSATANCQNIRQIKEMLSLGADFISV